MGSQSHRGMDRPNVRDGQWMLRGAWIHPLFIFWAAWLATVALYDMHLSLLLIYPSDLVIHVVAWIVVPYTVTALAYLGLRSWEQPSPLSFRPDSGVRRAKLARWLRIAFVIWALLTVIEIAVSGGVPLLWLIQGSSKTYFDFGIASVHGLLNSLILAIGLMEFALFSLTGKRNHLWMPVFVVIWSLIAVTRNMLIVILIECAIVWAMTRGITWKTLAKASVSFVALILVFGYIGDFRTGGETFRQLAEPSPNYPEWLPSGALWVYIYVGTPINNLVNTVQSTAPLNSPLFPNATSLLFPSVIRDVIYNPATISDALSGDLVSDAFNVSTAYVGAFQDFGMAGVAGFSVVLGWLSAHFWRDRSLRGSLIYAVMGQCLVVSIFFNHLFYLPVITQVIWLYMFLPKNTNTLRKPALP
jgi:oligosaccharide repeat unit polymerase